MKANNDQKENNEIDLIKLSRTLLRNWRFIIKSCCVAVLIGLVIAFSLHKEFVTEVKLAPELNDISSGNTSLGGLAAMAGVNVNNNGSMDAFYPDIYPDIVKSTPFLLELYSLPVLGSFHGNSITIYKYMEEYYKESWWTMLLKAPIKILIWVKDLFMNVEDERSVSYEGIYILNKDEAKVLKKLQENINLSVDKKTYVITVSVNMQDPLISAQIANIVLIKLKDYIIEYRTQKSKQDLLFTEKVYLESQNRYYIAQRKYAEFEDSNKHISTAIYRTEQERLRNEMSLLYGVYNTLSQKLEQDRLKVQEQTPVFAIIEPARVPLKPSSPRKFLIIFSFVFLGFVFSSGYILFKNVLISIYNDIKEE